MKILQVIPYFCFGGAETMCENLTYALRDAGHQVCVVSLYNEQTPISRRMEASGIRIRYLDKKLGLDISMVGKLKRIMKEEKPDVVHTHLDVIKYAVAAAKLCGIKTCVHTVHNVADKETEGRLPKLINTVYFKLGWSRPVALSPKVQATILDFYGLPEETVPVIYNGVDLSRCLVKDSYETDALTLLHIGRFNTQKNHSRLLEAFQQFRVQHPDARLRLVGDGELREAVETQIIALGLSDHVELCGSQSDVYPYLHEADIFLLPSDFEGMPMTVIEAMGTGLPVVATNVGGLPDMIEDGVSGLLTECTAEAVCRACEIFAQDRELREKLGKNAKKESEKFSSGHMARQYLKIYEQ